MAEEARYLFVYGTLMSGAGTALGKSQRLRLAARATASAPPPSRTRTSTTSAATRGRLPPAAGTTSCMAKRFCFPRREQRSPGSTPTRASCRASARRANTIASCATLSSRAARRSKLGCISCARAAWRSAPRGWPLDAALVSQRSRMHRLAYVRRIEVVGESWPADPERPSKLPRHGPRLNRAASSHEKRFTPAAVPPLFHFVNSLIVCISARFFLRTAKAQPRPGVHASVALAASASARSYASLASSHASSACPSRFTS